MMTIMMATTASDGPSESDVLAPTTTVPLVDVGITTVVAVVVGGGCSVVVVVGVVVVVVVVGVTDAEGDDDDFTVTGALVLDDVGTVASLSVEVVFGITVVEEE